MNRLLFFALLALAGCIKAPDVVIVDRHSLLEEQAAARMPQAQSAPGTFAPKGFRGGM